MKLLGLTGGIGAGKTLVTKYLVRKKIPVIDADKIAHTLTKKGAPGLKRLIRTFGDRILTKQKTLDRTQLSSIVFSDRRERLRLESILHPLIRNEILRQLDQFRRRGKKLVILSAALLFEVGLQRLVDASILVSAPLSVRKKRLKPSLHRRMRAQMSERRKQSLADYVIDNAGTKAATYKQVNRLLKLIS